MRSERQTKAKLQLDRKLSLLIALWVIDKIIMIIMLEIIR